MFKVIKTGFKDNGSANIGYKLFNMRPTVIRKEMLKPTHKTIFLTISICVGFKINKINKPGMKVKNKKFNTGLTTGKSRIIDTSVRKSIKNTNAMKFLILS
jgi:hypothetical protein